MPKLSDVRAGRIGEYLLSVYAMLTTGGTLVPFGTKPLRGARLLVRRA